MLTISLGLTIFTFQGLSGQLIIICYRDPTNGVCRNEVDLLVQVNLLGLWSPMGFCLFQHRETDVNSKHFSAAR